MHILFLTDNFPPEVNAPANRTYEHAKHWVAQGHNVTIITCAPNFPKGIVFSGYQNKLIQFEVVDGINVIRVWSFLSPNSGFLLRLFDHISYAVMAIFGAFFVRSVDVVIGTSPQFFTIMAAFVVSKVKKRKFVFELRDLWPASLKAVGLTQNDYLINSIEKVELFLYRRADLIVAVTDSFKKNLISRGIDCKKIKVVTNGVSMDAFTPQKKNRELLKELDLQHDFVCGYLGTHGLAHGLTTVLDTAELLERQNITDVKILFLGDGARKDELIADAEKRKLSNVIFLPTVGKDRIVDYWSVLDVSIVHLKKDDLFKEVIPSKIFESIAMGKPVVHGVEGESAMLIKRIGAGLVVPPEDPECMLDAILKLKTNKLLYRQLSQAASQGAVEFRRDKLAGRMLSYLVEYGLR